MGFSLSAHVSRGRVDSNDKTGNARIRASADPAGQAGARWGVDMTPLSGCAFPPRWSFGISRQLLTPTKRTPPSSIFGET
jgi:hypothetical protein